MKIQFYIPHPALQEFVSSILIFESSFSNDDQSTIVPFPPTPQHCIYFYVNDEVKTQKVGSTSYETKAPSIIVGPQLTRVNLNLGKKHKALCVAFHPGGLHRLIGVPMHELFDVDNDSSFLMGNEIHEMNEKLREATDWTEMKNMVEVFLLAKTNRLKALLPFDHVMKLLVQSDGNMPIEKIASMACLSLRQFERTCKNRIGLPPKLFARLTRFSKAYRFKEKHPDTSWTSIAHHCGYFDQMHLIRDFKQFAGVTPGIMEQEINSSPLRLQADIRI